MIPVPQRNNHAPFKPSYQIYEAQIVEINHSTEV